MVLTPTTSSSSQLTQDTISNITPSHLFPVHVNTPQPQPSIGLARPFLAAPPSLAQPPAPSPLAASPLAALFGPECHCPSPNAPHHKSPCPDQHSPSRTLAFSPSLHLAYRYSERTTSSLHATTYTPKLAYHNITRH
ncbi:uncharacterized protein PG986_000593 [Apiospora aurea]|uniref:Uncharacterized protein n=1 Tax=Apiospora aurea TaxID=335848 RepID=A0ABR1QVG8_9PEZI